MTRADDPASTQQPSPTTPRHPSRLGEIRGRVRLALHRGRFASGAVALVYVAGLATGIGLVHAGNASALGSRDTLVAGARASDSSTIALERGDPVSAALLDFGANVVLGAVPTTVAGLAVIMPFPIIAYRGWIGGIVSVRDDRTSRLDEPRSAAYYLSTLTLQLIPYTLTGGAGVALGVAFLRRREERRVFGVRVYGLPRDAVMDVAWTYALAIPLFLIASLWEFLSPL